MSNEDILGTGYIICSPAKILDVNEPPRKCLKGYFSKKNECLRISQLWLLYYTVVESCTLERWVTYSLIHICNRGHTRNVGDVKSLVKL